MSKNQQAKQAGVVASLLSQAKVKVLGGFLLVIATGIVTGLTGFLPNYGSVHDERNQEVFVGEQVLINPTLDPTLWPMRTVSFAAEGYGTLLRPRGQTKFIIPIVEKPALLAQLHPPGLQFDALEPGTTSINLRLRSQSGRLIAETPITLEVVRHVQYAGKWEVEEMRGQRGVITLHLERPDTDSDSVYGLIDLRDGRGLLRGHFTGSEFIGDATFGDMPARIHIAAKTRREDGYLIAEGTTQLYAATENGWEADPSTEPFRIRLKVAARS